MKTIYSEYARNCTDLIRTMDGDSYAMFSRISQHLAIVSEYYLTDGGYVVAPYMRLEKLKLDLITLDNGFRA